MVIIGRKVFRLTFDAFIGPFIATTFVVVFTLLIQFLWKYIDDMVGKGLEWYVIIELLFYASASFIPLALPLSVLLSSIMAMGKLAETYELVSLKSAGVSLIQIMMPLILFAILLSTGAFFFANNVIPSANLKFHSLLYDIRQKRPALDIGEGVFYGAIENYSIRISHKDKKTNKIRGILIYDHTRNNGDDVVMAAESGFMRTVDNDRTLLIDLYNGSRYEEMPSKDYSKPSYPANRQYFKSYAIRFDLSAFTFSRTKEELFKDHFEMLNINQLSYYEDSMRTVVDSQRTFITNFIKPYFHVIKDTTFLFKGKSLPIKASLTDHQTMLDYFPAREHKTLTSLALINARTVKTLIDEQSKTIDNYEKQLIRYQIEWQRKFSLSLACLTLFLIGAPLGAIIRKGGMGLPTVVAIFMFLVFYVIYIISEKSAKQGAISPLLGMWMPTIILAPVGIWLTYRANKDSISFNFDKQKRFIRKLLTRKKPLTSIS